MKNKIKILSTIILTLSVIFAMCACSNEPTNDSALKAEGIDAIYEIKSDNYGPIEKLNHKNLISDKTVHSIEANVTAQRMVAILDNNKVINYTNTVFYPVGNKKVYKYLVSGTEKNYVYLDKDGKINMMLYSFTKLDFEPGESSDVIGRLLIEKLTPIIDLSKYEYVDVSGDSRLEGDHVGRFHFLYYNMQDGYKTDYVKATVTAEGDVRAFSINNVGADTSHVQIDKTLESELLTAKLKDMYDTETTAYKSHSMKYTPSFKMYNDELCIEYAVVVEYESEQFDTTLQSYIEKILIPVRLISATNAD